MFIGKISKAKFQSPVSKKANGIWSRYVSGLLLELLKLFFCDSLISYDSAFVVKLAFTPVRTVAQMSFTGSAICTQGSSFCFVMSSALGASLLTVPAFRIWHNVTNCALKILLH